MRWVSLEGINWTVVLTRFETKSSLDFNCLSLVSLQDVTLLSTNKVLKRTSILVVLKRSTTEDLGNWLVVDLENFIKNKFVNWTISELFHIPPKDATIG